MMKRVLNLRQTILSRLYFSLISFACERTIQCFLLRFFYTRNLLSSETIFRVNVEEKYWIVSSEPTRNIVEEGARISSPRGWYIFLVVSSRVSLIWQWKESTVEEGGDE